MYMTKFGVHFRIFEFKFKKMLKVSKSFQNFNNVQIIRDPFAPLFIKFVHLIIFPPKRFNNPSTKKLRYKKANAIFILYSNGDVI